MSTGLALDQGAWAGEAGRGGDRGRVPLHALDRHFGDAHVVNLLPADAMLRHERNPEHFRTEVLARPLDQWIVVDEVQRVPRLLDEVHVLMEEHGYKRFALTGSSARKLKRGSANLLAGRAVVRKLLPLTSRETGFSIPVGQLLRYGSMSDDAVLRGVRRPMKIWGYVRSLARAASYRCIPDRYRFDDLAPRTYQVKRAASSSDYVAMPPSTEVLVGETDVAGVDLVVAPR